MTYVKDHENSTQNLTHRVCNSVINPINQTSFFTMVSKLAVAAIALTAFANAANIKRVACPNGVNFASHEAVRSLFIFLHAFTEFIGPVCCPFFSLRDDLQDIFDSECSEDAHESLRFTAVSFSMSSREGIADG